MLAECALVPDIFDSTCYSSPDFCDIYLSNLKEYVLQEVLVRDCRNGEWSTYVRRETNWHPRAKDLIRKLIDQRRLCCAKPAMDTVPTNYVEWCQEALASHSFGPLCGIIASSGTAQQFRGDAIVASIEKLSSASWWQARSPSLRLRRGVNEYVQHLQLVFRHANSFMFIDPHLDPGRDNYRDFTRLLQAMQRFDIAPLIEIHRVCYVGSGPQRTIISSEEWEADFRENLAAPLAAIGLTVEVFIWDDFHDRYLITDVVGIGMQNGFDTTTNLQDITTWFRLGRRDRDDIQREFDPAAKRHTLRHHFTIGRRR